MSCILRIAASTRDIASISAVYGLTVDSSWSRPGDRHGVRVVVSNYDFDQFIGQVADAMTFLKSKGEALRALLIRTQAGAAVLDFGVAVDALAFRTFEFPSELITLASTCGVSLAVSPYVQMNDEVGHT